MFEKRAQAAMEFLMTYGWAILVVLVAIGALAYFGVLSPDKFLPERCTGPAGLDCVDKASISADAAAGTLQFAVKNNQGFRINITTIGPPTEGCVGQTSTDVSLSIEGGAAITLNGDRTVGGPGGLTNNNQQIVFTIDCGGVDEGRFKTEIPIHYTNMETGINHSGTVSITGVAQ